MYYLNYFSTIFYLFLIVGRIYLCHSSFLRFHLKKNYNITPLSLMSCKNIFPLLVIGLITIHFFNLFIFYSNRSIRGNDKGGKTDVRIHLLLPNLYGACLRLRLRRLWCRPRVCFNRCIVHSFNYCWCCLHPLM
jgi:hypothetical protein